MQRWINDLSERLCISEVALLGSSPPLAQAVQICIGDLKLTLINVYLPSSEDEVTVSQLG